MSTKTYNWATVVFQPGDAFNPMSDSPLEAKLDLFQLGVEMRLTVGVDSVTHPLYVTINGLEYSLTKMAGFKNKYAALPTDISLSRGLHYYNKFRKWIGWNVVSNK